MTSGDGSTTAFRRVRQLFEAAVEMPAEERAAFLDRECRAEGGAALRSEVEHLLQCDANEGKLASLLERGAEPMLGERPVAARTQGGDADTAIQYMQRAFTAIEQDRGRAHPATFGAGHNLAMALLGAERPADALATTQRLLDVIAAEPERMTQLPPGCIGTSWLLRARALAAGERIDEAEAAAAKARDLLTTDFSADHPLAQQARQLAAELAQR